MGIIERYDERPDWLTVTFKYGSPLLHLRKPPRESAEADAIYAGIKRGLGEAVFHPQWTWKLVNPPAHYWYATHSQDGGVLIALGSEKQGIMVQFQGTWWAHGWGSEQFKREIDACEGKPTRFDYSVTVQYGGEDAELDSEYFYQMAKYYKQRMGAKYPEFGMPTPKDNLHTYTAGSRSSPKFMRVYEKLYWEGFERPAIRFEMEYKKNAAIEAWADWPSEAVGLKSDMFTFFFQEDCWDDIDAVSCLAEYTGHRVRSTAPKELPDRVKWFYEKVRPAFVKMAAEYPEQAYEWLQNCLYEWTDLHEIQGWLRDKQIRKGE